jgi:hypothetical protein
MMSFAPICGRIVVANAPIPHDWRRSDSIVTHPFALDKLPTGEDMHGVICAYVEQAGHILPDLRLRRVLEKAVLGIMTHRSPLIARMASVAPSGSAQPAAPAKQLYRFFRNRRVTARHLWQGLYASTRALVASAQPAVVPVIIDGVNLEKPYARKMPGLSTIHKDAARNRPDKQKLTRGFPALACVTVVDGVPALTFAHLFSYTSFAFVSVNREVLRAILTTRLVLHGYIVRFIGDKGFDDDETIACMARHGHQFLVRAYHHRTIEVWDPATTTWRRSSLQEYADTLPLSTHFTATFTHARTSRTATIRLGYGRIRFPQPYNLPCWLIVAHASLFKKPLWLLSNAPIARLDDALALWWQYRDRPHIEDLFRLLQERGLDIEDMRLRQQERLEKLMAVVWLAAYILWRLKRALSPSVQAWLRRLGGLVDPSRGGSGIYLLLYGLGVLLLEYFVHCLRTQHEKNTLLPGPQ